MCEMKRISPLVSQAVGLMASAVIGLIVTEVVWTFLVYALDFWHIGEVIGLPIGIVLGGLSAFEMFTSRRRTVPLYWIGVILFLDNQIETVFCQSGTHWTPPFFGIMNVPGPEKKFVLKMPGEKINAQDSAVIFFGITEDPDKHPEKRNRIQWSVVNPFLYMEVKELEVEMREAYLEQARLFFSQAEKAIGVKGEKTIFNDFLILPPLPEPIDNNYSVIKERHDRFEQRLRDTKFVDAGKKGNPTVRLFDDDAVLTIMRKAGDFQKRVASWGIGNIVAFTPNVRENPEAEDAAAKKTAMADQMVGLDMKVKKVRALAKKMTGDGVTADLSATLVAGLSGQAVDVKNETFNILGLKEGITALGQIVEKFGKPQKPLKIQKQQKRSQP